MAVNVMVQIGGKAGGQIVGHSFKPLDHLEKGRQLFLDRLDAHDLSALRRDILGEFNGTFLHHSGDFHGARIPRQASALKGTGSDGSPPAAELRSLSTSLWKVGVKQEWH